MVKVVATARPLNPDNVAPLFKVRSLGEVSVPVPLNVPLRATEAVEEPSVGFAPKGNEQSLPTVLVLLVWVKVTRLKV